VGRHPGASEEKTCGEKSKSAHCRRHLDKTYDEWLLQRSLSRLKEATAR